MNQLRVRNPQMFQMINQAKNSGANPKDFMKQVMNGATPEQMQNVLTQASNLGVPKEILSQIQQLK